MGNTINPEDHLLHVRAWKSKSNYPIPDDYPERQLPELSSKPNTAIAFSGGGLRAYASTFGFLAGLRDLGLLENIRYIGGVSSSSWAVAAYCYGDVKDDHIFLGPVIPPELLTLNRLNEMHRDCVKRLATTMIGLVYEGINTVVPDKQAAWNFTVSERFLKPVGINDGKFFTWSKKSLNDIFERNDHMVQFGVKKDDFLLPRRSGGPFPVIGWSLIGPDRSWIDDQYNAQHNHFRILDVTPLYIGQFSNEYAHFGTEKFKIGGVYEPYCFALAGGAAPEFGLEYDDSTGEILVPAPRKPLDFTNVVSISSYNPGTIFDSYPLPFTEVFLPFTANYWSPAFEEPTMRPTLFADGGAMQNIPLITFIQRGVEKIIAVASSYTAIDYEALQDYGNPSNWVFSKQIRTSYIDISLASFFGIVPSDLLLAHNVSSEYRRNHVFETDQFAELIEGFHKASLAGKGTIYRGKFLTIDNPYYGIEAGMEVDITFFYLEMPSEWYQLLPAEIKNEMTREVNIFDGFGTQEYANFPHYDTNKFQYTYRETNLLSSLVGWIVQENSELMKSVLSYESSANFVKPMESESLKKTKSLLSKSASFYDKFNDDENDQPDNEGSSKRGNSQADDDASLSSSLSKKSELDRIKLGRSLHAKMAVSMKITDDDKKQYDETTADNPMLAGRGKSFKGGMLLDHEMALDDDTDLDGSQKRISFDDDMVDRNQYKTSLLHDEDDKRRKSSSPSKKKSLSSSSLGSSSKSINDENEIFENPLVANKKKSSKMVMNENSEDEVKTSDERLSSSSSSSSDASSWWSGLFKPLTSPSSSSLTKQSSSKSNKTNKQDDKIAGADDTFSNPMMNRKPKSSSSSTASTESSEPPHDVRNTFNDVPSLVRQNSSMAIDNPLVRLKMKKAMMDQAKANMMNDQQDGDETKHEPVDEKKKDDDDQRDESINKQNDDDNNNKPDDDQNNNDDSNKVKPEPVDETPFLELPPEKMLEATVEAVKRASIAIFAPVTTEDTTTSSSSGFTKPKMEKRESIFDGLIEAMAPVIEAFTPEPTSSSSSTEESWLTPAMNLASSFGLDISSWGGETEDTSASSAKQLSARELAELKDAESRKSNLIVYDENPFDELDSKTSKSENLTDCKPIPAAKAAEFVNKLKGFSDNKERMAFLEKEKKPYLFSSDLLIKFLNTTGSVKTKLAIIAEIGPRLTDPKVKLEDIVSMFRFAEEKEKVRIVLKARIQVLSSKVFNMASPSLSTPSTPGKGSPAGAMTPGRGAGRGGPGMGGRGGPGRGMMSPRVEPSAEEAAASSAAQAEDEEKQRQAMMEATEAKQKELLAKLEAAEAAEQAEKVAKAQRELAAKQADEEVKSKAQDEAKARAVEEAKAREDAMKVALAEENARKQAEVDAQTAIATSQSIESQPIVESKPIVEQAIDEPIVINEPEPEPMTVKPDVVTVVVDEVVPEPVIESKPVSQLSLQSSSYADGDVSYFEAPSSSSPSSSAKISTPAVISVSPRVISAPSNDEASMLAIIEAQHIAAAKALREQAELEEKQQLEQQRLKQQADEQARFDAEERAKADAAKKLTERQEFLELEERVRKASEATQAKRTRTLSDVKVDFSSSSASSSSAASVLTSSSSPTASSSSITTFYSYDLLKTRPLPSDVDPLRKEEYLDDESFQKVFGVSKTEFAGQPKWKRDQTKKKLNLF